MAASTAGPGPGPGPGPGTASAARPDRGDVRTALTSRAAGWVVATLLAGALTGLAVNVATAPSAPSATVVRQVSLAAPGGLGRTVSPQCQVLAPSARIIYPPAKGGTKAITVPPPSPRVVALPAKVQKGSPVKLPGGVLVPSCELRLGLVTPGVQCLVGGPPGASISIHAVGRGKQVIIRRLAPVQVHGKVAKLPPGVQVLPGARLVCGG
jgi:hypothetical protein